MNTAFHIRLATIAAILSLVALVSTASARTALGLVRNGPWIAYSTSPACGTYRCPRIGGKDSRGSGVFLTRMGDVPKLVAGRDGGKTWKVCPAFSPNGRMLAFVRVTGTTGWRNDTARSTIVVVRIGRAGPRGAERPVATRLGD
ncbi:MAG TPA: hypothetical protein VJ838_01110, partial [Gaiellaceae bacterium]|nr:hypothetical protein [Gaiellaceae bacterium]